MGADHTGRRRPVGQQDHLLPFSHLLALQDLGRLGTQGSRHQVSLDKGEFLWWQGSRLGAGRGEDPVHGGSDTPA